MTLDNQIETLIRDFNSLYLETEAGLAVLPPLEELRLANQPKVYSNSKEEEFWGVLTFLVNETDREVLLESLCPYARYIGHCKTPPKNS